MFMKVQVFSIWKKKINKKDSRIRTHDPDGPVYYANQLDHWGFAGWWSNNFSTYSINPNPQKRT